MRLIITCGCGDTTQFAKDAFKIMFPKEDYDKLVEKPDEDLLNGLINYIALYDGREIDSTKPYAFLVQSGKYNKDIIEIYALIKGYKLC